MTTEINNASVCTSELTDFSFNPVQNTATGNNLSDSRVIGASVNVCDNDEVEHCSISNDNNSSTSAQSFPDVWTEEQWREKKIKYDWLDSANSLLGCKVCSSVGGSLNSYKSQGLYLSSEWCNYSITYSGDTREKRLKTLRSKISSHGMSQAHAKARDILIKSKSENLKKCVDVQLQHNVETTVKLFNTAYYLAIKTRPYADYNSLLELQKINGLDMGICLQSRTSATNIIDHIAKEFKLKLINELINNEKKISIIIDESTSISNKSMLVVYLRTVINSQDTTIFLDVVELTDQKSLTITNALLECLSSYGLKTNYLRKNLLCFASDGASVMLGVKSGVAKQLRDSFPDIIIWHCLSHRVELAVNDALQDQNSCNHFEIFIEEIYSLYNQSPKNWRQLNNIASELGLEINKIGKIFDIRWVASSARTVSAVWKCYPALAQHFKEAVNDENRTKSEQSKYIGLLNRL